MNKRSFSIILAVIILSNICLFGWSFADVILDSDLVPVDSVINNFSNYEDELYQTNGPMSVGDGVIWTAEHDGWIGDMAFGLRENGYWDWDRVGYTALNAAYSSMLFTFDKPIQFVGGLVNYAPHEYYKVDPKIEVLGIDGKVLESFSMDIKTPGEKNTGQFMGILRNQADIAAFRYIARYGVLDNLTYAESVIPEPSTYTMLFVCLPIVILVLTRRKSYL